MTNHRKTRAMLAACLAVMMAAAALAGCQPVVTGATQSAGVLPAAADTAEATAAPQAVETQAATPTPTQALTEATYSVMLDVNPSIELTVENGVVTKVTAFNDDAKQLTLSVDVSGMTADAAVKKLVEALAAAGYLNNEDVKPYLLVSVLSPQQPAAAIADGLKDVAAKSLKALDIKCFVKTADIPADVSAKAEALGISAGRYLIFDFIAKKEGITVEQAIAKYGALKVAELMRLYDGMDELFDRDDPGVNPPLTPDQQAAVDAALVQYRAAVKTAEQTYLKAKAEAISGIKTQWAALKEQYRHDRSAKAFKQAKETLRDNYKALRKQIHETFKLAIRTAREEFKAAVAALGLTDEQLDKLLDYKIKDFKDDSAKYLTDDPDADAPKGDADKDAKPGDKDNGKPKPTAQADKDHENGKGKDHDKKGGND